MERARGRCKAPWHRGTLGRIVVSGQLIRYRYRESLYSVVNETDPNSEVLRPGDLIKARSGDVGLIVWSMVPSDRRKNVDIGVLWT